jgi:hypothetical protein
MKFITRADTTTSNEASGKRSADLEVRAPGHRLAAGVLDLCRRRVDREDRCGRSCIDDQLGGQAGAATDIEPVCDGGCCQPVEEDGAGGTAPASDKALIGCAIVEAEQCICHGEA